MATSSGAGAQVLPELSVVIGSHNAEASVAACLDAMQQQCAEGRAEIIVVDNSTDGTTAIVTAQFPGVRLLSTAPEQWVPELWEAGIRASRGPIIALTTAHCVPDGEWMAEILAAHRESDAAGIGGAIENEASSGIVDWAVYFCRYAKYMKPFAPYYIHDIPADNASYKRWALDRCTDVRVSGFWEPDVHAKLIADGCRLLMTPRIGVRHMRSFTFRAFMRQRFWHGRQFGSSNARRLPAAVRLVHIVAAPLIPFLMLSRIARQVLRRKRHRAQLLLAMPVTLLFLASWAAGECTGYVAPTGPRA
ncbi:MAG: glycosyltransferase [Nitrospira sp.]|jgi:glycosyltransferase involved in cell wall biosynthesis|nr:glycosyltransferase [Nitrospira sp.]